MRCFSRCPKCIPLLRLFFFFSFHSFSHVFQQHSSVLEDLSKVSCQHTLEGKFFYRNIFEWKVSLPTPQPGELQNRSSLSLHQARHESWCWRRHRSNDLRLERTRPNIKTLIVNSWIFHLCQKLSRL